MKLTLIYFRVKFINLKNKGVIYHTKKSSELFTSFESPIAHAIGKLGKTQERSDLVRDKFVILGLITLKVAP